LQHHKEGTHIPSFLITKIEKYTGTYSTVTVKGWNGISRCNSMEINKSVGRWGEII